ncbi:hypothetical protein LUZ60_014836 [Juncus effusus]|nr:hypothetical protein LUZ60_014836 [Juncus effusus]
MPISHFLLQLTITTFLFLILQTESSIRIIIGTCHASGFITSKAGTCTATTAASCCLAGQTYPQYRCSPPITGATSAILYKASFSNTTTKCENKTYPDSELVVSLSTGWYNGGTRCLKNVTIEGNGNSVLVRIVGECDSVNGCEESTGNGQPCGENWIMASPAVWDQLGVPQTQSNELDITWSDSSS